MRTALRFAAPGLAAAVMLLAAQLLDDRAVLFPEAVALGYGLWALRRSAWACPVPLVAIPTTGAVLGVVAANLPGPWWWRAAAALAVMVLVLHVVRSPLIPAVSAAVLPVVFDLRGIGYVLAVAVWCALLAASVSGTRTPRAPAWPGGRLAVFVVAAAVWIAVVGLAGLPPLLSAPPLLVAGLEFTARGGRPLSWSTARRVALLAAAGVLGAVAAGLPGPTWVYGGVGVVLVVGLAALVREPLTPAAALVLVPFVAGTADPLLVGGAFALGGLVLTVVPAALVRAGERRRWKPARG
ncbi:hypothetical protein GCM10023201_57640 [Actinomycetospora corticicola]|uniref:Fusaric acid resistance family protein n=1 Tax=Actinomycetospora corticicola TaxID=663602 RepID=A0A7Y9DRQ8_9PSEU|nr:hypothetical protein [Actinomycetospora corticicola]NYD34321.1 hypothetical protein [Actinomycetospora corticicola]